LHIGAIVDHINDLASPDISCDQVGGNAPGKLLDRLDAQAIQIEGRRAGIRRKRFERVPRPYPIASNGWHQGTAIGIDIRIVIARLGTIIEASRNNARAIY
jgi:hypothetical protein